MYKHLLIVITLAIFTACSAPKPKNPPSWYTSIPKDFKFFYSVGSAKTITHAKNKAIINLREHIKKTLNSTFLDKKTKLKLPKSVDINDILKENERIVNTMSLLELKIDKTSDYKGEKLILIKLSRKSIFNKLDILASKRLKLSKENYALIREDDTPLKKYSILSKCMKDYPKIASLTEAKRVVLNSHNNLNNINYLNELYEHYSTLKDQLSIYVLSDINSRIYVKSVKDALKAEGIKLSAKPKSDKSLKLYITSKTDNTQEYSFNRVKTLVKYSTYDLNKKPVVFRQHTFSAKSRRSYLDAKQQTAVQQMSKIRKLGIFDFIGIK